MSSRTEWPARSTGINEENKLGSVRAFPLVVGPVDYNNAFDSVVIPEVIDALKEQGVEPVYVNVLQHI